MEPGILNILKEQDLLGKRGPNSSKIKSLPITKLEDIANEVHELISSNHRPVENPFYNHSASLSLGGGTIECAGLKCRLSRINSLTRFALLYSDQVYIDNFFNSYRSLKSECDNNLLDIKDSLHDDLTIIHKLQPLLKKGYLAFFSPDFPVYCYAHQAQRLIGKAAKKKFSISYNRLQEDFLNNMKVTCSRDEYEYQFVKDGPAPYFPHSQVSFDYHTPDALLERPRHLKKIDSGDSLQLSRTLIKALGFHTEKAHEIVDDVIHGITTSECLNTTFLTENDLHISFLNSLHQYPEVQNKNSIALEHLSSIVPFAEDIPIEGIIKLRQREEESFISYRQALNTALETFIKSGTTFTRNDALQLHADIIRPSLADLDRKVKKAKRDLVSKPFRSLVGVVGAISFGILTGLVTQDTATLAKTIGLVKFGSDLIQDTMALGDKENPISNDKFYFLWKLQKKTK